MTKTKWFKTTTNDGTKVKFYVHCIFSERPDYEPAIGISTIRIVKDMTNYNEINSRIPTYFIVRQTENYTVLATRSAGIKFSSLEMVNQIVKEFNDEKSKT